ncbi:MAG TPA: presqualene diphosphate synthase HpnD [Dehalococcoidia bacterium]|nr:presqualene diphosphate synthase HpnD [Dehalococcoidia bacterium]
MNDGLEVAYEYCRALTRQEARNFYYGFMLLPAEQRRAIYATYAFARECDDIVDGDLPKDEAARLLGLQRQRLEECLAGEPDGPVFEALLDATRRYQIPAGYFHDLIGGMTLDLSTRRYADFESLREYCYKVASVVGMISVEIFGYGGEEKAKQHAAELGIALQLTNILRDVQEDAARGRVYIPQEEIETFGYSERELLAGEATPAFRRLVAFQAARAREYFAQGRKLLPYVPRRARACVGVMAGIYEGVLSGIERDPAVVFRRRVGVGTGRKLVLAGRELVRSLTP